MMLSMLVVLMPRLIVIESITFDLSQNSLRAGTVWVNCYDVLEAQVMIMINIFNDDNDNQTQVMMNIFDNYDDNQTGHDDQKKIITMMIIKQVIMINVFDDDNKRMRILNIGIRKI